MSESPFEEYDEILRVFLEKNSMTPETLELETLDRCVNSQGVILKLKNDGYIFQNSYNNFAITAEGRHFIANGGYVEEAKLAQLEKEQKEAEKQLMKQVQESTIATNKSIEKINAITSRATIITVMVSVVTLIVAISQCTQSVLQQGKDKQIIQSPMSPQKSTNLDSLRNRKTHEVSQDSLLKSH